MSASFTTRYLRADVEPGNRRAPAEGPVPKFDERRGESHDSVVFAAERRAMRERERADSHHALGNMNRREGRATLECAATYPHQSFRKGDALEGFASVERVVADQFDLRRENEGRQAGTVLERGTFDFDEFRRERDAFESRASLEEGFAQARQSFGENSMLESAFGEGSFVDIDDLRREFNLMKRRAA